MASPFKYIPVYGVEPFKNVTGADLESGFGGGANFTNQNLLISLWQIDTLDAQNVPATGRLLQPSTVSPANEASGAANGVVGINTAFAPFFDSRTSFKLLIDSIDFQGTRRLVGIMNPPSEYKTRYINALKASLNNAFASGLLLEIAQSIQDAVVWDFDFLIDQVNYPGNALFGSPLIQGSTPVAMSFTATSGADGVFPLFYTPFSQAIFIGQQALFVEQVKQIIQGNFYVPVYFEPSPVDGDAPAHFIARINWPHSAARGG